MQFLDKSVKYNQIISVSWLIGVLSQSTDQGSKQILDRSEGGDQPHGGERALGNDQVKGGDQAHGDDRALSSH